MTPSPTLVDDFIAYFGKLCSYSVQRPAVKSGWGAQVSERGRCRKKVSSADVIENSWMWVDSEAKVEEAREDLDSSSLISLDTEYD